MKNNNMELLAPAGSLESLHAAVFSGADAVYMGGSRFSARAFAENFNDDILKDAIDYCHLYKIKVYITINTLIKESEIMDIIPYAKMLYEIGVDAVIVQDFGVYALLKSNFPDFEIHASTQMTIHNLEGALYLKELGFHRVVLSRELSMEEIKNIAENSGVEIEVFVHGALCICYSGQCLMSSLIGGRSGNRGKCAQPCRQTYMLKGDKDKQYKNAYLLSPKDLCTIDIIEDFVQSGVKSLKIEGRMKRPEYVAGVVKTYRNFLDASDKKTIDTEVEKNTLLKLFNREGFTKAYLKDKAGTNMMSYSYAKNTGIYIGEIEKDLTVKLQEDVNINDGIRSEDTGFIITKIIKGNKEVNEAFKGEKVKLFPTKYNLKDKLYKTSDSKLLNELSEAYRSPYNRKLELNIKVSFKIGEPLELFVCYDNIELSITGDIVQEAVSRPITIEKFEENIRKTNDTPYIINNIEYIMFENGFLPISSINSARRELLSKLSQCVTNNYKKKANDHISYSLDSDILKKQNKSNLYEGSLPQYFIVVSTIEQFNAAKELGFEHIAIDIFKRGFNFDLLKDDIEGCYLVIPNIIKGEFDYICDIIIKNLAHIRGILTANMGIIRKFSHKTAIIGDYKLNVFNSYSAKLLSSDVDLIPLSIELNKKEMQEVRNNLKETPLQVFVYGRAESMVSEHCILQGSMGCVKFKNNESSPCSKDIYRLKDKMGEEFLIKSDKYCRSYIYNSVPINLVNNLEELRKMNFHHFRVHFTDETYLETCEVLKALTGENKELNNDKKYTKGHYKRGVE